MSGEPSSTPESLRLSQLRRVVEICDRFDTAACYKNAPAAAARVFSRCDAVNGYK